MKQHFFKGDQIPSKAFYIDLCDPHLGFKGLSWCVEEFVPFLNASIRLMAEPVVVCKRPFPVSLVYQYSNYSSVDDDVAEARRVWLSLWGKETFEPVHNIGFL